MSCTLIMGGARSGKSAWAESEAIARGKAVIYIATSRVGDAEMAARIAHHRARRPAHWQTVEESLSLAATLAAHSRPDNLILVDCLTLWLSNLLFAEGEDYPEVGEIALPARFHAERAALLETLPTLPGDILLVSNEVGMGIVPWGAVSRAFADEAGRLNQALAQRCQRVVMLIAGLPLTLKEVAT
ncbi:MAG: bifunctional adenosylcobinamide kinase/adenosylcobinamide-phosphate guanylyltransferase [Paludibacterium sp.]|uniref:bifunctional adenosylcobinamide kinase/adenosylcobinamide-phosphate guanylyltransferase n=1 Tax=Paludibacterium sp. TaxID=1917523 RepID=UPI0025D25DFC|nr:bifunctional adenosylcobinamide kinase/adenosylcobinamide-phosphate guanylyltransferase [Paludibacterium sp.]MBV8047003.1 bifunctional adenosylcobinamide kinase/adenosylcobinamide-phosphate guanylyltransferase [Paludibacterium sp.]MBV8649075.1 bifunctional adenosylcobinamide kinase/adenosylcobinamide-phosphate guanylyltransferase [Paludibacterium sp.]